MARKMENESWEDATIKNFELVQELVRSIRNLRSEFKVEPNKRVDAVLVSADRAEFLEENKNLLVDLAGLNEDNLTIHAENLILKV